MTAIHVIDEYTDANAVAAIAAEDAYIKNIGDTILGDLDFNSNHAVNMLLEVLSDAPIGEEGRIYFDNVTNSNGEVDFMLDAGTYYVWREKAKYIFTNPQTWSVS